MDNDNKNGARKFLDWVNADEGLPSLAELEHAHEDHGDGHEDGHGDAHGEHEEAGGAHGEPAQASDHAGLAESDAEEPTAEYEVFSQDEELAYPDPVSVEVTPEMEAALEEDAADTSAVASTPEAAAPKRPAQLTRGQKKSLGVAETLYGLLAGVMAVIVIAVLLLTVSYLPAFGDAENPTINEVYDKYVYEGVEDTGAINLVAGMILDYRAFDTLGESVMLFTATIGVIMLIRTPKGSSISGEARKEGKE